MAEPHAHSQPIQTYGPAPHNRNIWSHNSWATAAPPRLADSFVCAGAPGLPTTIVIITVTSFVLIIFDQVSGSLLENMSEVGLFLSLCWNTLPRPEGLNL